MMVCSKVSDYSPLLYHHCIHSQALSVSRMPNTAFNVNDVQDALIPKNVKGM